MISKERRTEIQAGLAKMAEEENVREVTETSSDYSVTLCP